MLSAERAGAVPRSRDFLHLDEARTGAEVVLVGCGDREAAKRGATPSSIRRQVRSLKRLRAEEIESRVVHQFGSRALMPVSDCVSALQRRRTD